MRITKKKALATVAVASVVALGAGSAYAFWTTAGTGSGSASVGTDAGFSIAGDITPALLLDQARPFNITVTNNASFAQHLSALTFDFTPSNSNCLKSWFTLVQPTIPGQVAASPLDRTQPANDLEFFALGQMEVTPKMMDAFQKGAGIAGPFGYIIDLN